MKIELNGVTGWSREDFLVFLEQEAEMSRPLGRAILNRLDSFLEKKIIPADPISLVLGETFSVVTVYNTVKTLRKPLLVTLGGVTSKSVIAVNFTAVRIPCDDLQEPKKASYVLRSMYGRFTFRGDEVNDLLERYREMLRGEAAEAAKRRRQAAESAEKAYEFTLSMVENHCWK